MSDRAPVSVVVPTIGRIESLRGCLDSIASCVPGPDEVVIVDQSGANDVSELVGRFDSLETRVIQSMERGISRATNAGLREARNEVVFVTHDDCTVDREWIGIGWRKMESDAERILTGRVLPAGDPSRVPVTKTEAAPEDYTGTVDYGVLRPMNMLLNRDLVLEIGGFDERFDAASEDNDLCYRWLTSGRRLMYEPDLVVWHHDIRTPEELRRTYVRYWRGQGRFFAKHLWQGDLRMLRFLATDVYWGIRTTVARIARRKPIVLDWRHGRLRGLPLGLLEGAKMFRRGRNARSPAP